MLLSLKAAFAGLILAAMDISLLVSSFFKYLADGFLGVKQTPDIVTWNGFPSVLVVPSKENLDFNFWRKLTYILPTLKGLVKNKVKWLLEEKRVSVLPDDELYHWVAYGPLSRLAKREGDTLSVSLHQVQDMVTDDGIFLMGPTIEFDTANHNQPSIRFSENEIYTPNDGSLWTLSKLHVQAAAAFLLPGRFHGNIHFGLPCVTAASLACLKKTDVLYQLLEPHVRFTLRINNEALRVQRAQDRSKPYAPFPVSGDEFVKSIAADVKEHLMEPGFVCPPWSLQQEALPFVEYGKTYYDEILTFIDSILPSITKAELQLWGHFMQGHIPEFKQQPINEALATIIWQVSFLHSVDHYAMESVMHADKYLFSKMRLKVPSQSGVTKETPLEQVINMACDAEDRFRSNVFASTFIRGYKHPLWSNTMDNIQYKFKDKDLKNKALEFQKSLKNTESELKKKDLDICPLSHVFHSICW